MLRWMVVFFLALVVFQGAASWLRKIGLGKLPGDFTVTIRGREVFLPVASSLLLSGVAAGIGLLI